MKTGGTTKGRQHSRRSRLRDRAIWMLQVLLLMVGATLSVATKYANSRYCHIRQTSTVPLPTPSLRPPRRSGSYAEAGIASHTSVWSTANNKYAGQQRNLYSTRQQLGGYVAFSLHRTFSLGASFEVAIPAGEQRLLGGNLQLGGRF